MRIRTHGVATAAALALMSACASAPVASGATTPNAELTALRTLQVEQTRRIAELEARLSLLEADARRARDDYGSGFRESVRIGGAASELTSQAPAPQEPVRAEPEEDEGKRPTLRLYGNASSGSSTPRASLPPVPVVNERLPVVPLPEQRAAKSLRASGSAAAPSAAAPEQYRKGLRALRERRYDDALAHFAAFVSEQPRHELVPSALYWRGEALYAKRDYSAASAELESLIERYPSTSRAPDALLKLGMSYRKLGAIERADQVFQRLRRDFPTSQAAAVAAREGST